MIICVHGQDMFGTVEMPGGAHGPGEFPRQTQIQKEVWLRWNKLPDNDFFAVPAHGGCWHISAELECPLSRRLYGIADIR
jgi:hypothetical protein